MFTYFWPGHMYAYVSNGLNYTNWLLRLVTPIWAEELWAGVMWIDHCNIIQLQGPHTRLCPKILFRWFICMKWCLLQDCHHNQSSSMYISCLIFKTYTIGVLVGDLQNTIFGCTTLSECVFRVNPSGDPWLHSRDDIVHLKFPGDEDDEETSRQREHLWSNHGSMECQHPCAYLGITYR